MSKPILSSHFESRKPSDVRLAQMKYDERKVKPEAVINVGIGNVSLPTNPAMMKRMFELNAPGSPFENGVVRYSGTAGTLECQDAFKNILKCEGFDTSKLHVQVTDGGSAGMELLLIGVCGPAGSDEKPLMMIDPAYTNYISFAERLGRKTVTVKRQLSEDGNFDLPELSKIEESIKANNPGALLVIPYDNPTGQLYDHNTLVDLAKLCVKYNMWMISDEAYRELYYEEGKDLVSIWGLTDAEAPGIEGRRISIETASKVWNACGLRIGAVITDSAEFNNRSVAEYTANLCANVIGQYIFGALAHETKEQIAAWSSEIRGYYKEHILKAYHGFKSLEPGLIVSSPDASIYTVLDVRNIVKPGFDAIDFVLYCAQEGSVVVDGVETTLLVAPMKGFYDIKAGEVNPGSTQFRISFVETPENMAKIPYLFVELLRQFEAQR
ncbi:MULTISPECIES: pyridoxal phosphate-dependent aminotransferase [unclassified Fusibacter]|uniref:pyridoxal phosphate-dependent aminotransferase n=1 Tax=unclassified Fusibacter TaxID=2624464 RepID=UPI0010100BD1|nr:MULTISPECIES: pyridoxal phosphate-dependent aminotransferase [unclassified Fusibacter]MCK8058527.1 pyridoxal phosphate-dependent aminotransferase [Fusibacter sp. A2]NPE22704.1 pyridoxal phosphate-dependent aminotransferase [Fusibacter sp. A1]RXV60264.1 pyridoxal phosphate-dependent aminotransferase [Fusibacter sp. A1]